TTLFRSVYELKVAARKSAATSSLSWSIPVGKQPISKRPVTGVDQARTTPGSRWLVGHATLTAYTLGNRRRTVGSLAIPFWRHTIGVSGGATVASSMSAMAV